MIALIDADSIIFVVGWNYKDIINDPSDPSARVDVEIACDNYVSSILTLVQADSYIGAFSSSKCFRNTEYKVAPYKGKRPEKPDWVLQWSPVIKERLVKKWNFIVPTSDENVEADDIICALAEVYGTTNCVICSPDKDLKQIPGIHYDYKKEGAVPEIVSQEAANRNFWMQMLCGDTTDNILGVPGLGPVKATNLLLTANDPIEYGTIVMDAYCKYYGQYYGPVIFKETQIAVQLLSTTHPLWHQYVLRVPQWKQYESTFIASSISPFQQEDTGKIFGE